MWKFIAINIMWKASYTVLRFSRGQENYYLPTAIVSRTILQDHKFRIRLRKYYSTTKIPRDCGKKWNYFYYCLKNISREKWNYFYYCLKNISYNDDKKKLLGIDRWIEGNLITYKMYILLTWKNINEKTVQMYKILVAYNIWNWSFVFILLNISTKFEFA